MTTDIRPLSPVESDEGTRAAFAWVEQTLNGRIVAAQLQPRWARQQWFLDVDQGGARPAASYCAPQKARVRPGRRIRARQRIGLGLAELLRQATGARGGRAQHPAEPSRHRRPRLLRLQRRARLAAAGDDGRRGAADRRRGRAATGAVVPQLSRPAGRGAPPRPRRPGADVGGAEARVRRCRARRLPRHAGRAVRERVARARSVDRLHRLVAAQPQAASERPAEPLPRRCRGEPVHVHRRRRVPDGLRDGADLHHFYDIGNIRLRARLQRPRPGRASSTTASSSASPPTSGASVLHRRACPAD